MDDPETSDAVAQAKAALERLRAALGEAPDSAAAAREALAEAVRRRPLTALAIAFGVGLALAALTRG